LLIAFLLLSAAVYLGDWVRRRQHTVEETERKDLSTLLPATLTLLTLLIGFSFSMAAGRYDQRKSLEEEEANAIGTEYVRADLIPAHTAEIQSLLKQYLAIRIEFYNDKYVRMHPEIAAQTAALQARLWNEVAPAAVATPNPIVGLVTAGMNDVLNSQGYTQAMYWNRLPPGSWLLMLLVATFANFMFGYSEARASRVRLVVLPIIVALPLYLIADLDAPRGGLIHVVPQNLMALQQQLE
jgi:hypothetical protein